MHLSRLDGLRALAILAVMLHHHEILRIGWAGVDLFFVLSGYLITKGLRADRNSPRYWARFYAKRTTRILPAALVAIAVAYVLVRPPMSHVLLYVFFLGNVASISIYHRIDALTNFWSLAVEEHFYLCFPFAVRNLTRRSLIVLLTGILIAEPVLRLLCTGGRHSYLWIYYLTPFRLDGLASGALLAITLEREDVAAHLRRWSGGYGIAAAAVFGLLSWSMPLRFDREANGHLFNSMGYTLLAACFVFTMAYVLLRPEAMVCRLLSWRPLTFIGTISYGLYLYHQFVHYRITGWTGLSSPHAFLLSFPLSVLVSWLSFRYFERGITRWGRRAAERMSA